MLCEKCGWNDHGTGDMAHTCDVSNGAKQYRLDIANDGNWIALADQIPPDGKEVLRYPGWAPGDSGLSIDVWCSQYGCFLMSIEEGERATHWRPLPQPPNV